MDISSTASSPLRAGDYAPAPASSRAIVVWPVVLLLAAFWTFIVVHYAVEMEMGSRFFSRMIVLLIFLVGFLAWWGTRRGIRPRDRWLAVGLWIGGTVLGSLAADSTMNLFAYFLSTLPMVLTAWGVWVVIARKLSPPIQRVGFCVVLLLSLGFFDLVRSDGLWGDQIPRFSWRWDKTAEETFLESLRGKPPAQPAKQNAQTIATRAWTLQPGDWPEFRGANRDGVISDARLVADWKANPPRQVWRHAVGPGWSSVIVVDGHVVTQEQRGETEAVVAYNAATGVEEWSHEDKGRFFEGLAGAGPRATPTFHDGAIYALGAAGRLNCLDAATGEVRWSHDIVAKNEATVPQWGLSISPLVVDGLVIVYAGGAGEKDVVAYRADSGEVAWFGSSGTQSYSSPQLFTFDGVKQVVMQSDTTLDSFNLADGEPLWQRPNGGGMFIPMLQPHLVGENRLLVPGAEGVALVEVKQEGGKWSTSDVTTITDLEPSFNDYALFEGHLYGFKDGILRCVDLQTGKMKWKKGRYGHGQLMLVADQGLLLIAGETGDVSLVAADPAKHKELSSFHGIDGKTWNHPVVAHGRLYIRNDEEMACYELTIEGEAKTGN